MLNGGDYVRRKTDMDILIEHKFLIIGSILLILFGIFVAIAPHIHSGNYDSLQTKEVTITEFKRNSVPRDSSYDYICTTDGEKYNLSGDYQREQLQELLTEGRTITIRWYKNTPFWTLLAEEIYVDGERVVAYDNDLLGAWKTPLVIGICAIALGIGGFFFLKFSLKSNRKKQKKRNERIRRKYEKLEE